MSFLSNFGYIAIALFCLGFSIFIHELGHFVAAKKRGLIADRFSIGFGPRIFGWKWRGTDFRLSLLPLGGYVSLPQLADMGRMEGGEKEDNKLPPISYTDKMIVAVMGAVFNIILAFCLSLILWGVGREVIKSTVIGNVAEEMINSDGERVPGPAYQAGIRAGDEIIEIDGQAINSWWKFQNTLATGVGRNADKRPEAEITVLRGEETLQFTVNPELASSMEMRFIGVEPETVGTPLPQVLQIEKDMPAFAAGLQVGDKILKLDGEPVVSSFFLNSYLQNHKDGAIQVTVDRAGTEVIIPITPRVKTENNEKTPRFGFAYDYEYAYKFERVHYNPIEQLASFVDTMRMTLYALLHRGSNVGLDDMSGPVGIVHGLTRMAQAGWIDLIWFVTLINVNLGLFNLLPIPVLDGGHMTFATIAKLRGKQLPQVFMEKVQMAFVLLLLGFMVYVTFFDVGRVGRDIGLIQDEIPAPAETTPPPSEEAPQP